MKILKRIITPILILCISFLLISFNVKSDNSSLKNLITPHKTVQESNIVSNNSETISLTELNITTKILNHWSPLLLVILFMLFILSIRPITSEKKQ
ncbi:MAG: hypothetical protein J7J86_05070 [Bacteroidales bacterium]|nr:hypothetical protein [Bacteroidales bacterium]